MRIPAKAIDVACDQRDEAHGDCSANAVAARSDEHAELWGEHEAQLVGAKGLAERDGKRPRNVSGGPLQRKVDKDVEDVGNGIDKPEENQGKQRGAEEACAAKEKNDAGTVGKDDQRVRRNIDGPLRREDKDEDGLIADVDDGGGDERG